MPKVSKAKKHAMIAAKKIRRSEYFEKQLDQDREFEYKQIAKEFYKKMQWGILAPYKSVSVQEKKKTKCFVPPDPDIRKTYLCQSTESIYKQLCSQPPEEKVGYVKPKLIIKSKQANSQ
jgi:hypothetical protein